MEIRQEEISRLGMVLNEAFKDFMNESGTNNPDGYITNKEIKAAYACSQEYVLTMLAESGLTARLH